MGDSRSYYEDRLGEENEEQYSKEVIDILDLYNLLKPLEKVAFKKVIRDMDIF